MADGGPTLEELKLTIESETGKERKARLAAVGKDPHRPRYHYVPSIPGFYNDPKPFFSNGECHLFFSYNPEKPYFQRAHPWGHAFSTDYVTWRERPIPIAPTANSPDMGGCMSGCVIEKDDLYYMFYTGVGKDGQHQCLAVSEDCCTWSKHADNPVIGVDAKPGGFGETFRDPQVWKEDDGWYMVLGGNQPGGYTGAVFLYRSEDLYDWGYVGILYTGDYARDEVPDFFRLGDKHVLLSSRTLDPKQGSFAEHGAYTFWAVGEYEDHRFTPESGGVTDYGKRYYAAKTFVDDKDRRILWGWIQEEPCRVGLVSPPDKPGVKEVVMGWGGVQALPRIVTLRGDSTLAVKPVPELQRLREQHWDYGNLEVSGESGDEIVLLEAPQGKCLEIVVEFDNINAEEYGLVVLCSPDCEEQTRITYNRVTQRLLDAPLVLSPKESVSMHVFVDTSVVEAFGNDRVACTIRSYPQREDSTRIGVFARRGSVRAISVDVWTMRDSGVRPEERY